NYRCPLYPQKRTFVGMSSMSAKWQKRTSAILVRTGQGSLMKRAEMITKESIVQTSARLKPNCPPTTASQRESSSASEPTPPQSRWDFENRLTMTNLTAAARLHTEITPCDTALLQDPCEPLVSVRINRQFSGRNLPPLMFRASARTLLKRHPPIGTL